MEMDRSTVTLMDEAGRSLTCFVEVSVPIDQEEYALLNPVDYPVDIFGWVVTDEEDEIVQPVEEQELAKIFPTAQAVLSEQNLKLKRSALSLTVEGDLPDIDEEEILVLEMEEGDEISEQEEYQLLATFFEEEQEYSIYTPIDPVLFVVRLRENMQPELLSPQEFQALQPKLQPLLEERLMDDLD
ncbi:DUF3727 domain-containing protein [Acaryochloris marina]|uniref:DUF3727 domain-containing protein n=1 Tax=Acaryochloris marina (strain MBIC 11017) TaxID=329726 RepID=B0C511_ACAM1|nr:DUF3727 domain-containing protein [Acaryochloris marina]ABW25123.1 conserved hypothetical protein [Acaryochloris marina MBIC11017]BDM80103.1 hypothetical protein AM10699_29710 [Acaryochloris marina MBIC10699]